MKVRYSEILFCLFFGCLFFAKGIGLYDGQTAFKLVLVIAGASLVCKCCLEQYNKKQIGLTVGLLVLGGMTYTLTGEKGLLLNCMLIAGMHHMDSKKVFRLAAVIWSVAFSGTMICSLFHMEDTVYKVHSKLGLGHVFRWSMGYGHPNVLQITYFILAIIIVYLLGENFKIWHGVLLFVGNCFFFLYSLSYTGFAVVMCLLIGRVYLYYRPKLSRFEKILLQMIYPLCILLSLAAPLILEGKAFQLVNKLMNTRLELAKYFLTQNYIHLFGNRLSEIVTEAVTMDNSYVFAFITYGIIPFVLIVAVTIYAIYQMCKQEKYLELLIFVVVAIGGLTEPFLYNTSFKNLSLIFMGELLFSVCRGEEKYSVVAKHDREIYIRTERWKTIFKQIQMIMKCDRKKITIAFWGAVCVCAISHMSISYPEGYVVYRADCEDLDKVFYYYGEENGYDDYYEMEDFAEGELVEYFSGNIIVLEKVRNCCMAFLLGFVIVYVMSGICIMIGNKRRKVIQ